MAGDSPNTIIRTYKCRLLPRKAQHARLRAALDHTRELYNAALEERIGAYRKVGKGISYYDQCRGLTELRSDAVFVDFPVTLQRWPLKKLDLAFKAFFRRIKAGEKPGFPRFKGRRWFKTFGFTDSNNGWRVDGNRLHVKGIGRVRLHLHRPLPSDPVSCVIKRDNKGWAAHLDFEVPVEPLPVTGREVGIDMGLTNFVALSTGETIPSIRPARRAQKELRRRQRALTRCMRGSNRRRKVKARVARLHEHIVEARRTFHYQVAARLVRGYDLIAIENLNVKPLSQSRLARDVNDAAWSSFIALLAEKAEKAARELVKVDAHHTSQTCPECGNVERKALSERIHRCACGCVGDRDVIAARVILSRAVVGPGLGKLRDAAA